MIGGIAESVGDAVLRRVGRAYARVQANSRIEADLLEDDDSYLAVFDAPGANVGNVQVRFVEGQVLVRIDRFRTPHEGFDMRFPGRALSMDGEISLPDGASVDPEAADATLTDKGTLEVRIPKAEPEAESVDAGVPAN